MTRYRYLFDEPDEEPLCPPAEPAVFEAKQAEHEQAAEAAPKDSPPEPEGPVVLSVSDLTLLIKDVLEAAFPAVWVSGEVCDLSRPRSGHCYLTLKDEAAQLPAVLWRTAAGRIKFDLCDGLEVICRGRLEVYGPRGKYQLIVDQIEPKGMGALELALRQLRQRLGREGLFDSARKRRLPRFVRKVGVVTSPTGAALRDFLEVLRRRWRGLDALVIPVRVQGEGAAAEIAAAIAQANALPMPLDCLALIRGGGSLEDLWAFNEEVVVRAVAASRLPIITGIGHEIDVTLADLAADVHALTPSEAAERLAPSADEMLALLRQFRQRLDGCLRSRLTNAKRRLENIESRRVFRNPLARVRDLSRRLDETEGRLLRIVRGHARRARTGLESLAARLDALSPLAVLGRGYSLTQREDGRVVRSAGELLPGDRLLTRFASGRAVSRVEEVE